MALGYGVVLQQVATKTIQYGSKYLDYALAGAIGTGIGIGANPEIQQLYQYYRGKTRYTTWQDKYVRRRFKGDVLIDESSNTQQEALRSDEPFYRNRKRGGGSGTYRFPRNKFRRQRLRSYRRCKCKSNLHRTMGFRKRQRYY